MQTLIEKLKECKENLHCSIKQQNDLAISTINTAIEIAKHFLKELQERYNKLWFKEERVGLSAFEQGVYQGYAEIIAMVEYGGENES